MKCGGDDRVEDIIFCKGGGCTAKLGAGALSRVLSKLPKKEDPNLLVGFDSSDDAAVYKLTDDLAMVQTLDFFPPMITDPYIFGQIAATNALSDIYAMGGKVLTALNIVCFPESMDLNILGKILQGGNEKVLEAGAVLAGGHSIADDDIKYGLSVSGIVHPDRILKNQGSKVGDKLYLTKPLGVGIVCTANRIGKADEDAMDRAIKSMTTLNKYSAEVLYEHDVHGCTDVTGFGLIVHLLEMLGDNFSAVIEADRVPYIPKAYDYAMEFYLTAAAQKNRNHAGNKVKFEIDDFAMEEILFDPQTSGGLLFTAAPGEGDKILADFEKNSIPCYEIGHVTKRQEDVIVVV